jgi:hypothetical protein
LIFSGSRNGEKHIEMIFGGKKHQTRRPTGRYKVGHTYAVQPKRCAKADPRGRILIKKKTKEGSWQMISESDAAAEGGYTPEEYEALYTKMYPGWSERYAYEVEVVK